MCVYVRLGHFAVLQKLTEHCKSTIIKKREEKKKKQKKERRSMHFCVKMTLFTFGTICFCNIKVVYPDYYSNTVNKQRHESNNDRNIKILL